MLNKLAVVALIIVASPALAQAQGRLVESRYSAAVAQGYYEGRYSTGIPQGYFATGREEMLHATGN
jgi:hypothetical protein